MASWPEGVTRALEGRTALVTGGSRGIGLAVARRLAGAGCRLALVARGEPALQSAARPLGAIPLAADVGDADSVARLGAEVRARLGVPDIVVNAAGVFELAPLAEAETASFDRHLAVNLRGPFLVIREFLPGMLARGSGHLVTVGSIAGRQGFAHNGAYSASKFGVRGLHAVLDAELRGTGVRSTLVEPAATATSLWDAVDRERTPGLPPPDRMLEPDALGLAVLFAVASPKDMDVRNLILDRT